MNDVNDAPHTPYVSAERSLPELTFKAIGLGIVLSVLLSGANAYLGLKAGMTVSASIPAAVISMTLLRLLGRSNILENNIVQTSASAGESLAAGVIFTLPALVILGVWTEFNYWETTIIAGLGGAIGVLFTIPLRRALVVGSDLTFPEGVATAEVLKVGDSAGGGFHAIITGGLVGALFKVGEAGFRIWSEVVQGATRIGSSVGYVGASASPALIGVGYIVGLNIAVLVFIGGAINFYVAIPIIAASSDWPTVVNATTGLEEPMAAADHAMGIWSGTTRYLGVGAMLVGGVWALLRMGGKLVAGIKASVAAYGASRDGDDTAPRTERDTPMQFVGVALAIAAIPVYFVFEHATGSIGISLFMSVIMLVAGFLFSAVASYMAGLVGSSNNPISGVTIATLLTSALLLLWLGMDEGAGPRAAILIGAVVCCAAAIGGDNMQDLKAGHILGATPWKQQVMQIVGVVSAALVMAPVLGALLNAYGMGTIVVEGQTPLEAPQATLMSSVAEGVFTKELPWPVISIGMLIAVAVIVVDLVLERLKTSFRAPVLAVAVGIYLPLYLATPILIGGLISFVVNLMHDMRIGRAIESDRPMMALAKDASLRNGLLLAAGLITGEALVGILLAVPLAAWGGDNKMAAWFHRLTGIEHLWWPGIVLIAGVCVLLGWFASKRD